MLGHQLITETDALLDRQRKDRGNAHNRLCSSVVALENGLGCHVYASLDGILATQRRLEDECLALGKNQVMYHQKTIRWKAEYKRFRSEVEDLQKFEQWMQRTEANMHATCGTLEYVCYQLNRTSAAPPSTDALPSLFD
ncbi:hypothetical protein H257_08965 [Aphanomyces astaci]|uniref:Uncharacterized protein n=1 Tax=Aphanomyces astaci TaxID=112090 RepID=W4GBL7_APHAT|nr:hypothetical protein H257_08965 [Aphanomyces astaci]ETV77057.1 hypothetical protein H257_08965 [Aphanomyces astaci]RQM27522.1 hypothetical protein B5M09_013212 [Aphanomyces astaci]|eukprot:XP_009833363.1 hypothetical protein H257_08965 [Aphanomyces astaci]